MTISKKTGISIIALSIILYILMSAFVSCGGLSTTPEPEETSNYLNIKTEQEDSPEAPTIKPVETITLSNNQTEETEDFDESEKIARYAASSESNKYHLLSCHYVDRIKSYNIVYYYSESEAKNAGKFPCSVCRP